METGSRFARELTGQMQLIPSGKFTMGAGALYPDEGPPRTVEIDGFWMDRTPVTNRQFKKFVDDTGYVTFAEKAPDPLKYPGILPEMIQAGSLLFDPPTTNSVQELAWWKFEFGACWREPLGPGSSIDSVIDHPVVHIAYEDAEAYAAWAGKSLPSEAQWEYAARGGLEGCRYAWGDQLAPDGQIMAKYWVGPFPWTNLATDGHARTAPVKVYPENGFGLFDMIGNVWEWTSDWYATPTSDGLGSCCHNTLTPEERSYDPAERGIQIGRKVLKGGSHLCAENYCQRYRPAARYPQPVDTTTSHVGFRCVYNCHIPAGNMAVS